jgi:hypothetical protein
MQYNTYIVELCFLFGVNILSVLRIELTCVIKRLVSLRHIRTLNGTPLILPPMPLGPNMLSRLQITVHQSPLFIERSSIHNLNCSSLTCIVTKNCYGNVCHVYFCTFLVIELPITMAAPSKAWTVFAHSNTGVMGSNPTRGMGVCVGLFCVCIVLCVGSGLTTGWSSVQGVQPTLYRLRNWKRDQGPQEL